MTSAESKGLAWSKGPAAGVHRDAQMESDQAIFDLPDVPTRLTEAELARHWRLSVRTLQRWREAGTGPDWIRVGRRILYPRVAVIAFERRP